MFSSLSKNSLFYILDKNNKPKLEIGKVSDIKINPQCYGMSNQEMDICINVDGNNYEFKKIPANVSIISPASNIIISDNADDMFNEFEQFVNNSQRILDSIDYHKGVLETKDNIFSKLNSKYAKEKEHELKLTNLEGKVQNMEQGIEDIKTMLLNFTNQKQGG